MAADLAEDWLSQIDELTALSSIFSTDDFKLTSVQGLASPSIPEGTQEEDASTSVIEQQDDSIPSVEDLLEAAQNPPEDWLIAVEILVHVNIPQLSIHLDDDTPNSTNKGYIVQHLPPLVLRLALRPGYPSTSAPLVSITAPWLTWEQLDTLVERLNTVWDEQGPGLPVVFSWTDWLQYSALEEVGLAADGRLILSRLLVSSENNNKNSSRPEVLLMGLLKYNAAREYQLFETGRHTCNICFEEQPGSAFLRLDCSHYWCRNCLATLAKSNVQEGSLEALKCPEPKCGAALEPHILQSVLQPDEFARYDQLMLQRALDSMTDVVYCPRCQSIALEDADNHAACPKCFFDFCSLCNEARHPGTECVSAETKLEMLRKKAEGGGAAAVEELRRREQELMSVAVMKKTSKPCPQCGIYIERSQGCNKMTCTNCGAFFCYRCNTQIKGYDHFEGSQCILFDEAEILRWERQWDVEVQRHQMAGLRNDFYGQLAFGDVGNNQEEDQQQQGRGRRRNMILNEAASNCPSCGQLNYKIQRNNHMCCWSCTRYFCACCRTVLQGRGGNHFKPGGCKQHS